MGKPAINNDAMEFIETCQKTLPPVLAREEVHKRLGGVVSSKTLANYDRLGKGPEVAFTVGRKVVYKTDSLLTWVATTLGISRHVSNIKNL